MSFTTVYCFRRIPIIIREVVMIERELGNWKDFIEVCFVSNS
ncbi:protein YpfM [Escherichia coli]|nr:protein YpfM [Escherichia coli]